VSLKKVVWFNRLCALGWAVAGVLSFPLGWAYSVAFVTIASIYANVKTDWGAGAAEDDSQVLEAIANLREEMRANACQCSQPVQRQG
jgi:hypothetical protein